MTEIEKKALALVNATFREPYYRDWSEIPQGYLSEALCRAIEQHEAFRKEVGDAVEKAIKYGMPPETERHLSHFILPKPVDPLVEVLADMGLKPKGGYDWASEFRNTLAARGLEIVKRSKSDD